MVPPHGRTLASPREGGGLLGADLGSTSFLDCLEPLGDESQTEEPALVNVARNGCSKNLAFRDDKKASKIQEFERRPDERRVLRS